MSPALRRQLRTAAAVVVFALAAYLGFGQLAPDSGPGGSTDSSSSSSSSSLDAPSTDAATGLRWISEADLPVEARETLELIDAGGPFPYPGRDGATFENREGLLPPAPRGHYAEYTVPTPGEDDRGPRRIVVGDGDGPDPEWFWTDDHYDSFARILRE
ncbi:ribonuclease domain-containing protein [Nocardioides flavescens]|uniref:Ribonuclease n=1 Tax=Nocardioides flavescens TaxID=2691959 RepID=A0A6L7F326_9ACTN|nr:ribonuclease [Nocardioides flavescens]